MALIVHFKMIALCYINFPSIKRGEERKGGREGRRERVKPKGVSERGDWVSIRNPGVAVTFLGLGQEMGKPFKTKG